MLSRLAGIGKGWTVASAFKAATSVTLNALFLNGSNNTAVTAMLTRVAAGTGNGKIEEKGDSTGVGIGVGSDSANNYLSNARASRPTAILASLLSQHGYNAVDARTADNAVIATQCPWSTYDPCFDTTALTNFSIPFNGSFAGGGTPGNTNAGAMGPLRFTPEIPVDTFEIVFYRSAAANVSFAIMIDGAAPASGPASVSPGNALGFGRVVVKAASLGTHTLSINGSDAGFYFKSISAYDGAKRTITILNDCVSGATMDYQTATNGNGWGALDALRFEAPDLGIINGGLNEMNTGVSTSTYTSSLDAFVMGTRVSGAPLIIFPHPVKPEYEKGTQASFNAAAKSYAASKGVAFLSLYDQYGSGYTPAFAARLRDGIHPMGPLYAEIAELKRQAIMQMAA